MFTRIYDVRTRLKVKQDELAKLSGVSQSQISKYEKGEVTNPSFDKLVRIAEALGVTVDDLRTQTEEHDFSPIKQPTSAVFVPLYQGKTKVRELDDAYAARLGFNRLAHQQIRKPSFLEYSDTASGINYNFNSYFGTTTVFDLSGNGNHGTVGTGSGGLSSFWVTV